MSVHCSECGRKEVPMILLGAKEDIKSIRRALVVARHELVRAYNCTSSLAGRRAYAKRAWRIYNYITEDINSLPSGYLPDAAYYRLRDAAYLGCKKASEMCQ